MLKLDWYGEKEQEKAFAMVLSVNKVGNKEKLENKFDASAPAIASSQRTLEY